MRCNCYEIGGNVFSLSELECFVIRGELSKGTNMRSPFVSAPKSSKGYHIFSLIRVDPRVNLILVRMFVKLEFVFSPPYFIFKSFASCIPKNRTMDLLRIYLPFQFSSQKR